VPLTLDLSEFCHRDGHHQYRRHGASIDAPGVSRADSIAAGLDGTAVEGSLSSEQDCSVGPSVAPARGDEYELSAVVVHAGRLDAGHYYCLARHEVEGGSDGDSRRVRWVRFNDYVVREVSEEEVLQEARGLQSVDGSVSSNAYLLFYTRKR
jgi:ubiquitin C-terminal hydrolase